MPTATKLSYAFVDRMGVAGATRPSENPKPKKASAKP